MALDVQNEAMNSLSAANLMIWADLDVIIGPDCTKYECIKRFGVGIKISKLH